MVLTDCPSATQRCPAYRNRRLDGLQPEMVLHQREISIVVQQSVPTMTQKVAIMTSTVFRAVTPSARRFRSFCAPANPMSRPDIGSHSSRSRAALALRSSRSSRKPRVIASLAGGDLAFLKGQARIT
ncbi:MAG: hypothetical protein R3F54_16525 [Alphaproteobacteria bacterium]